MRRSLAAILVFLFGSVVLGGGVNAASSSTVSQVINAGTLVTDIMDSSRVSVGSPAVSMSAKNFSFDCQVSGSASTGTLGTNSERLYVTNPGAANNGWNLTIAATGGATTTWSSTSMDFNDPTGSTAGCSDGADADAKAGQLTIDPSVGTLTADCGSCSTTNVSKGSSAAFNQGTTDSIALLNAAAASDDIWRGYLTGATLSQTIPAETTTGTFTLGLTLTATAL